MDTILLVDGDSYVLAGLYNRLDGLPHLVLTAARLLGAPVSVRPPHDESRILHRSSGFRPGRWE
jgi:hypothetical protein